MKALSHIIQSVITPPKVFTGIIYYRIKRHFTATLFSVIFAFMLVAVLCFLIGEIYPDFRSYCKKLPFYPGNDMPAKYNFYSGEDSGVYSAIGKLVTSNKVMTEKDGASMRGTIGLFRNHDTLINCPTGGGFDNFLKVTTHKNSFGLVQEAVLNLQDEQLRKGILMEQPLFTERLHIFYRKALFQKIDSDQMQLSANTDPRILERLSGAVNNIQVGIVGSCTRIIASDVIDLLERQIKQNLPEATPEKHRYKLKDYPLSVAMRCMEQYAGEGKTDLARDSVVDMMFLVGADPTNDITRILDNGEYGLMSVNPSFMGLLNKEFSLNLMAANFYKKYDRAKGVNTVGTLTFLIASGDVESYNVKRMLRRIHNSAGAIHKCLITLPPGCNDSCYSGVNDKCGHILPLAEFGFFKHIKDEDTASAKEQAKAMIPFLIAMVSFLFPILKSVSWLKSLWQSWCFNKKIDQLLLTRGTSAERNLQKLTISITDLYGDGELCEAHYNALTKRISVHIPLKKQPGYKDEVKKKSQLIRSSYRVANG